MTKTDPIEIYVIPYNAPWYELLFRGVLTIETNSGNFGVKTGSVQRRHRGWVGFYNSKGRVRNEVVSRHKLDPNKLNLGMLVGVGYLEDSRPLTDEEKYQWYLHSNKIIDAFVAREAKQSAFDPHSIKEKIEWLDMTFGDFAGHDRIIAGPGPYGHFYGPDTVKRLSEPIPLNYPSGPVMGAKIKVTKELRNELYKNDIEL